MKPIPTMLLKTVAKVHRTLGLLTFGPFIATAGLGLNDGQNLWRRLAKHGYIERIGSGMYEPTAKLRAEIRTRDGDT